jgi:hypothetical protein
LLRDLQEKNRQHTVENEELRRASDQVWTACRFLCTIGLTPLVDPGFIGLVSFQPGREQSGCEQEERRRQRRRHDPTESDRRGKRSG